MIYFNFKHSLSVDENRLSFSLIQHFQLLNQQIEQQRDEIELITSQVRILKEQLKCESDARIESQVKQKKNLSKKRI